MAVIITATDSDAPSGALHTGAQFLDVESEIKNAVAQSVFFIPIITPTVIARPYCRFEWRALSGVT